VDDNNFGVPAGWYPDPLGLPQLRWWDAQAWTEHTSEARAPIIIQPATRLAYADDDLVSEESFRSWDDLPSRREQRERERESSGSLALDYESDVLQYETETVDDELSAQPLLAMTLKELEPPLTETVDEDTPGPRRASSHTNAAPAASTARPRLRRCSHLGPAPATPPTGCAATSPCSRRPPRRPRRRTGTARTTGFGGRTPRQAAYLLVLKPENRQAEETDLLERVMQQHPDLTLLVELADEFLQLLRQRQADAFDDWLLKAASCALKPLQTFAKGLFDDYAAVKASLMTEFSNGPVEGLNNKLKLLKRQMYGRASLELLAKRFILAA